MLWRGATERNVGKERDPRERIGQGLLGELQLGATSSGEKQAAELGKRWSWTQQNSRRKPRVMGETKLGPTRAQDRHGGARGHAHTAPGSEQDAAAWTREKQGRRWLRRRAKRRAHECAQQGVGRAVDRPTENREGEEGAGGKAPW
jgi:hypothetical protein